MKHKKWEYMVRKLDICRVQSELNLMGEDGWELIDLGPRSASINHTGWYEELLCFFKRELHD